MTRYAQTKEIRHAMTQQKNNSMRNKLIALLVLLIASLSVKAQVAKSFKGTFALTNATIETVTNGTIENGTLVIQDGKIAALGTNVNIPAGAERKSFMRHIRIGIGGEKFTGTWPTNPKHSL